MRRAVLGLCLAVAATAMLLIPAGTASAATENVDVSDFWFCNSSYANGVCDTTIDVGDTVQWDWVTGIHAVRHCGADCDNPTGSPLFDSGQHGSPNSFQYTFNSPGIYLYYCTVHPLQMRGRILVGVTVGGVSELPALDFAPSAATGSGGGGSFGLIALASGAAAGALAIAFGAWYLRRRIAA